MHITYASPPCVMRLARATWQEPAVVATTLTRKDKCRCWQSKYFRQPSEPRALRLGCGILVLVLG